MGSPITTHILDTSKGAPAAGVTVSLECLDAAGTWQPIGRGVTDDDGRIGDLVPAGTTLGAAVYQLLFEVGPYFQDQGVDSFYRTIPIVFDIGDPHQHYHVPLLLNPFGYSTYRGS